MDLAPILLFVYDRPAHTRRVLASLAACHLAADSHLYVCSDAARTTAQEAGVQAVRSILAEATGFASIHIIKREHNYGLAANVIDGVTMLTREHGRVIVLEDDLTVAPHFLEYMNDALRMYADEERVCNINACEFTGTPGLPETFFIQYISSWGWATWERAWRLFEPDGQKLLSELRARRLTHRFDFNGRYHFTRMLREQVEGKNHSWAIRWQASLFLADRLSLGVGRTLVVNEGFDGSGTNCGTDDVYASTLYQGRIRVEQLSPVEEDADVREAFGRYYGRMFSFWAKVRRRLRRILPLFS